MATVTLSGLASGFDWNDFIDQMLAAERIPQTQLRARQATLNEQNSAFSNIKSKLTALQTSVAALKDTALYDSRTAQVSDASAASASASAGAVVGSYTFNILQLATASRFNGAANVGSRLSSTSDVSSVTLATAGFTTTVQAGTFTVNGRQVAIATTDTLQQVFDKIAAATNNDVAASYDPNSDRITLASVGGSEIVLGSATDTSNFLQVARLANNGTGTITSTSALGGIRLTAALDLANFATAVSDGGGGAGEFRINGVSIAFSADTDTVNDVIARINNSAAGVTASYDSLNDRFLLTSKATGDLGIALEDVTGNFLAAAGLSSGTLARGNDLTYSINGGDTLTSRSNTITADSSGIAGVSVTALKENSTVTVTVNSDTSKVRTAITDFLEAYNAVQSYIDTQSASSTSPAGKVTAGLLANDSSAREISSSLRRTVFQAVAGLSETIDHLADLGIQTSGYDNKLTLSDSDRLDAVLANDLNSVKRFFSDATSGLAVQFDSYLTRTMGEGGILTSRQESLTRAASNIDDQIASMEKVLEAHKQQMIAAFTAMEEAQARINQQLAYLTNQFAS